MSKRETPPSHPELSHPTTKRAKQIDADNPFTHLTSALSSQNEVSDVKKVAHWFRSKDLRIHDNIALHHASTLAAEKKTALVAVYMQCPEEESWHGTSAAREDFVYENLNLMQKELKELNIPLVFIVAEKRAEQVATISSFIKENGISHVFANYEYYVDEIRRDLGVLEELGGAEVQVSMHHDQCVVEPGTMLTGGGKPMKVFTPYHHAWLEVIKEDPSLLDTFSAPTKQDAKIAKELKALFDQKVPEPGEDKQFESEADRKRIRKLWPAGHAAAEKRMATFIKHIDKYAATRSNPAKNSSSRMSAYFSSGMYSVREALSKVREYNDGSADFTESGASKGVYSWVREIVFRELYRQTSLEIPHTAMNLPQNLKFEFVNWEEDEEGWEKWCKGQTGEPFIDAGMRQLNHEAYMHNRLRMNVSSYLYCNLLIDYRRGERYFAETLIDWDLSNNTNGWEPSYTVFNPVSQAERNDPDGDYIRKWVPELKDVQGKAVFAPYARLSKQEFEKLGYPKPHVDWKDTKARAIERFKSDMRDASP